MSKAFVGKYILIASIAILMQAANAHAQGGSIVGFQNKSKTTVKVCVYAGAAELYPFAEKCMTLKPGEKQRWDRANVPVLSVFAFDPGVIDIARCSLLAIPDPLFIEIFDKGSKNCVQATERVLIVPDPKPTPTPPPPGTQRGNTLRVCNTSVSEPVYFAITFALGQTNYFTQGWWSVNKGECQNVDLDRHWREQGLPTTVRYKTYIYGETAGTLGGIVKKVWEGDDPKLAFCINENKGKFGNKHQDASDGVVWESDCTAANGKRTVKMWPITIPKLGELWKWNF